MKKGIIAALLCLLMAVGVFGCKTAAPTGSVNPQNTEATGPLKIGIVLIGTKEDKGYTYAHVQGFEYMKAQQGSKVELFYRESVNDGSTEACITAIESLINDDECTVIFTTSYGYMEGTKSMAEKYPNVKFMHCSGYEMNDTNFGNYFGRMYQARYLSGIAAGAATQTNKIGYVAAHPIGEVIRGINAFTLGVLSVNPDAKVYVTFTNTWYDPTLERSTAEALLQTGCDVIAQHQDTDQPVVAAKEANAFSVGYNADMSASNPDKYLCSPIWHWGVYYNEQVTKILNDTWQPKSDWYAISTGIVGLDSFGASVTQATKDLIAAEKAKLDAGTWDVFTGPIKDQTGTVKVAEGTVMPDGDMLGFNWFVEGVVGEIPAS